MNKKIVVLAAVLLAFSLAGWGCAEKAAEKVAEKAIEDSAGGDVDVDIDSDDDSATIEFTDNNTNSTMTIGATELPDNWPTDVPEYQGEVVATSSVNDTYFTASWLIDESVDSVYDYYQAELVNQGWEIATTWTIGNVKSLTATKDNRTVGLTVGLNEEDDQTSYTINVSTDEE